MTARPRNISLSTDPCYPTPYIKSTQSRRYLPQRAGKKLSMCTCGARCTHATAPHTRPEIRSNPSLKFKPRHSSTHSRWHHHLPLGASQGLSTCTRTVRSAHATAPHARTETTRSLSRRLRLRHGGSRPTCSSRLSPRRPMQPHHIRQAACNALLTFPRSGNAAEYLPESSQQRGPPGLQPRSTPPPTTCERTSTSTSEYVSKWAREALRRPRPGGSPRQRRSDSQPLYLRRGGRVHVRQCYTRCTRPLSKPKHRCPQYHSVCPHPSRALSVCNASVDPLSTVHLILAYCPPTPKATAPCWQHTLPPEALKHSSQNTSRSALSLYRLRSRCRD